MHPLVEELESQLPTIQQWATAKVAREIAAERERPYDPTARVSRLIPHLEMEQFRDPDDRDRWNEIRELTREQVRDDRDNQPGQEYWNKVTRHGSRVGSTSQFDDDRGGLWDERSERERILEFGLEPFLEQLSGEQRVLIRMYYGARMSSREIAAQLSSTRQAVEQRLATIHRQLHKAMQAAFPWEEEE